MSVERFNQAVKLRTENHLDDARSACERLWQSGFQNEYIALLRGNLSTDFGEFHNAENWHRTAWGFVAPNNQVRPECAGHLQDVALPLAYSRMRLGWWDLFTWQLWEIGRIGRSWNPAPGTRPWDGSPEKMIVLSEGGYGDAFLFTRFFQKLDTIQRGGSRFVMGPQFKGLKGFRDVWDGMAVVNHDEILDWSQFKYSTALMSLMAVMGIKSPADIPAHEKFTLPPDNSFSLGSLASLFAGSANATDKRGPRLGLCWHAEELGQKRRTRSIDNLEDLAPLAQFSFVSLNPGYILREDIPQPRIFEAGLASWTDTARVIAGLDMVVTVDTAVMHLAGLLGVPTLAIVPMSSDWKFGPEGDSNWWWKSVRVIRNTSAYSFRPAVEKVAEILEKL